MSDAQVYELLMDRLKRIEAQNDKQLEMLTNHALEVDDIQREMHRYILAQERDMVAVHGRLDQHYTYFQVFALGLIISAGFLGSAVGYILTKLN